MDDVARDLQAARIAYEQGRHDEVASLLGAFKARMAKEGRWTPEANRTYAQLLNLMKEERNRPATMKELKALVASGRKNLSAATSKSTRGRSPRRLPT